MKVYKISSRLLFSLLLAYTDMTEKNLVNYKEVNRKTRNKYQSKGFPSPKKISPEYIKDLTSCVGNAIFKKKQEIYYTKLDNLYALFYGWQSTLKYLSGSLNLHEVITDNLAKNNHSSEKETKRFLPYRERSEFDKAVYKAYKKMTWTLFSGKAGNK